MSDPSANPRHPASPVNPAAASTREALLDAAEQLFATHGFDGVALRDITQLAKANSAAVNYHFQNKENLFAEVIARRMRPLGARRLALLKETAAKSPDRPPRLADLLEAFARPLFEEEAQGTVKPERISRLLARVMGEADLLAVPLFEKEFLPVARQYAMAIAKACPELNLRDIALGILFYQGGITHALIHRGKIQSAPVRAVIGGRVADEEVLPALVRFGVGGFLALGASDSS